MIFQSYSLVTVDFVIIGVLPAMTLRSGQLTRGLFVTATLLSLAFVVVAAWSGVFSVDQTRFPELREMVLTLAALASITLVAHTARSHRIPLALWHQRDDTPVESVSWGSYRFVRHPFMVPTFSRWWPRFALTPGWPTIIALVSGGVVLRMTALDEEHRLMALRSRLGLRGSPRVDRAVPAAIATGRALQRP